MSIDFLTAPAKIADPAGQDCVREPAMQGQRSSSLAEGDCTVSRPIRKEVPATVMVSVRPKRLLRWAPADKQPPPAQLRLLGKVFAPCNGAEYTWNACAGTSKIQHAGKKLKHFVVVAAVVGLLLGDFNLLCKVCRNCLRWLREGSAETSAKPSCTAGHLGRTSVGSSSYWKRRQ